MVAATTCWLSENPKSQTCCHLLHALSLLPLLSYNHPSHIERYLNSWHVADYIHTGLHINHSPTESSSHHHPSDHSHYQLLFSFCWTHQLHYTFLDLGGRHSGRHGKVSFWLVTSSPLWSPNITDRGNCSWPYSQPHWDWSSNYMDLRTLAMQMTPRYICLSPQANLQSLTISQTVYWAYPHHYLTKIKIGKTELLLFLANQSIHHNIAMVVQSLGIMIDAQQSFSDHIASGSWSCCFASFNTQKISLFLT